MYPIISVKHLRIEARVYKLTYTYYGVVDSWYIAMQGIIAWRNYIELRTKRKFMGTNVTWNNAVINRAAGPLCFWRELMAQCIFGY